MYQSQAAIWSNVTSPQAAASAQAANGAVPLTPAADQQSLLDELLATNSFRTTVATASPLAAWLAANPPSTLAPSGLAGLLHGTPALTERIRSALVSGTSTTLNGPQVMTINFSAQTPGLAHDTLQAMLATFAAQRAELVAQSQGTVQILDPASTPAGPTTGATKSLATILYGLIAGVIVSLLAVVVLTLVGQRGPRAAAVHHRPASNGRAPAASGAAPSNGRTAAPPRAAAGANGDPRTAQTRER